MRYSIIGSILNIVLITVAFLVMYLCPMLIGSIAIFVLLILMAITHGICSPNGYREECRTLYNVNVVIAIGFGLSYLVMIILGVAYHTVLSSCTSCTEAEIIDINYKSISSSAYLKVETDDGERYTISIHGSYVGIVGDKVSIRYNPNSEDTTAYASDFSTDSTLVDVMTGVNPKIINVPSLNQLAS